MKRSKVSVIIPSIGRPTLPSLIQSIAFNGAGLVDEVRVVFDSRHAKESGALSAPSLRGLVATEGPELVVETAARPGVNAARNRGASGASGEVLIFLDDDVEVSSPAFFHECLRIFLEPGILACGGGYRSSEEIDVCGRAYNVLCSVWRAFSGTTAAPMLLGGCLAVRRETWQRVGGFDESILYGGSEVSFVHRIWESNGDVRFSKKLDVIHHSGGRSLAAWIQVGCAQAQAKIQAAASRQGGPLHPAQSWTGAAKALLGYGCRDLLSFLLFVPVFFLGSRALMIATRMGR